MELLREKCKTLGTQLPVQVFLQRACKDLIKDMLKWSGFSIKDSDLDTQLFISSSKIRIIVSCNHAPDDIARVKQVTSQVMENNIFLRKKPCEFLLVCWDQEK